MITDATGAYSFANVPLPNATGYTLTQTQPIGLLDGKQTPGTLTLIQAGPPDAGANAGTASTATNTDTISGIRFTRATNAAGFDFGELRPAVVRGFVYEDNNNNGQREAGEAPIVGVNIRITGTDIFGQAVNQTAGTDTTGEYVFNVPPSDTTGYTVEQVAQPAGYFDGKEIRGQIGAGPPPPANVIPNSSNAAGATGYSAGGVSTGTTNAATDRITGVVVGSNQISQDNSFGELRVAQISGAVFLDQNGNAIRDVGETTGVPGIVITLTGTDLNGNTVTATATSDTSGNYTFANLLPGIYNVTEGPVAAYTNTGAAVQGPQSLSTNFTDRAGVTTTTVSAGSVAGGSTAPVVNSIAIGSGGTSLGNNFGLRPSRLAGRVCIDNGAGGGTINNGRCEAGETGIAGVTVTLSGTAADGTAISLAALTDSVGSYVFSSLKLPNAAGYTLTETQPSAFVDGRQAAGTLTPFAGVDLTPLIGATTNVVGNDA
ncbi:MAG: SdrD B-like domain-containing protein, partial [bacterium]